MRKPYELMDGEIKEIELCATEFCELNHEHAIAHAAQKKLLQYIQSKRVMLTNLEVVLMQKDEWQQLLKDFEL